MTTRHLLLLFLLFFLVAWRAQAQFTPQGFNYQCIVRDATGATMNNKSVTLLFTVRAGSPNGPVSYSETQATATNEFGLVNLVIGQGNPLQGTFPTINWGSGAKFLTVSVETAPNVFDELGSTQLMSVPYALSAQTAGNGADDWGTQVVQTAPALSGDGTPANPLGLAQQSAQTGQVLKWDGSGWTPQNDAQNPGTITQINTGTGLTGGPIINNGTISLENTPVAPGVYGSSTAIPVITVDQTGRVTDVFTVLPQPSTVGITGAAGINVQQNGVNFTITNTGDTNANDDLTTGSQADGDVSGPFSNLQIKANAVGTPELADDAINSAKIVDNSVNTNDLTNGAVTTPKLADGAVSAVKLNDMGAASGQVLKWNGSAWAPSVDNLGTVSLVAGQGIGITGTSPNFTITNSGDTNAADDITTTSQANGDVTGPFADLQIKTGVVGANELGGNAVTTPKINPGAVTGDKIAQMSAATGQVLKWDGGSWSPGTDITGAITVTGGVGIDVIVNGNNYIIANGGDINPFDDVTENSTAGGDLSGPFNNLQIKQNVITNFEMANNAISTANLQNGAVTGDKIAPMNALNGQVLKWNGTTWAPAIDNVTDNWGSQVAIVGNALSGNGTVGSPLNIAQQGASNGQVLKWNGTFWAPAADAGGDNWGIQTVQSSSEFAGNGTVGTPLELAAQGATLGQVLKWNGTSWTPDNDNNSGPDNWGTQTAVTNPTIAGNGTVGDPLRIAAQNATNGQVLKWNGTLWAPANEAGGSDNWGTQVVESSTEFAGDGTAATPLELAAQGATLGQVLKWNGTSWTPDNDNNSGSDNWGTQTAVTSPTIAGNGTVGDPLRIAPQNATNGQVLKWNGTLWAPANDNNTGGDNWGAQTAAVNATLAGNGTVGSPLGLAPQGANPGQILKWNGSAWLPADDNVGSGPADNWGTQVAITNTSLLGNGTAGNPLGIAQQGATPGQVLQWNGTAWAPGSGAGDNWGAQVVQTTTEFIGNGTIGNPLELASQGASFGQVLKWAGTFWAPGDDENTGDNWGAQSVESSPEFGGSGTLASPLFLAPQGATPGQVLKWTGSAWAPAIDLNTGGGSSYTAGAGISITGVAPNQVINNTGDLSITNELQTLSLAGSNLTLSNGGGTVALPPSNSYSAGTGINITGSAPNFTIVNTGDTDNNPTNEIQTISLAGNNLSLSNGGGTVALPSGNTYSAGTGISITGSGPNFTINNTGDADKDPANELQTISLNGTTLKISGINSEVKLDTLLNSGGGGFWSAAGNDIYNSNAGNVGIGTDVPLRKLHIKTGGEAIRLQGADPGIGFANGAGTVGGLVHKGADGLALSTLDSSDITLSTGAGKSVFVNGLSGNMGIGAANTSISSAKLAVYQNKGGFLLHNVNNGINWEFQVSDVNGNLLLFNNALFGGAPAGTFTTNGMYIPSDRRLKKDITHLSTVLDKIMQLEPVNYRYRMESTDAATSVGFIAQDVQQYFPEFVTENTARDGNKYLAVNYTGFSVLAIKGLQEQQGQIELLRQENENLRDRMNNLELRLQQLERPGSAEKK